MADAKTGEEIKVRKSGAAWREFTGWGFVHGHWLRRKHFSARLLGEIAERIRQAELGHSGELMVAVEAVVPPHEHDNSLRALEVFGRLRVWDTPGDTGVLLYLALDRHHVEIIADRGVGVPDAAWKDVCTRLQAGLAARRYGQALLEAVDAIETLLQAHCPAVPPGAARPNALPDEPVLL
ncbi:TPM domain-containing protein [Candidimonas humi]|uniref:TPM domain-containing protein n=1 Tax=Candidimonas humi TaxID=683355 RepID=A0ABV8P0B2_9BURK|nr:TPM domain-containing protein [Candidimonas humi]MBV6304006.1 TPM domain-containing protein [Candidimonas humi]